MKHIDNYKIFEGKLINIARDMKIKTICYTYGINNYTINNDGSIDIDGDVAMIGYNNLLKLPLKFNKVSGYFACFTNRLQSLENFPKYVGKHIDFSNNMITSLEGCTENIGEIVICDGNPIYSIVKHFIYRGNNLIELFNYYDIVQDMNVIYDRLEYFYSEIDIKLTDEILADIEKNGYKIIR